MSIRDFLCELKLPAVLISVVTIVWCTALRAHDEDRRLQYYPPDEQFIRLQQAAKEASQSDNRYEDDRTVRLELDQ